MGLAGREAYTCRCHQSTTKKAKGTRSDQVDVIVDALMTRRYCSAVEIWKRASAKGKGGSDNLRLAVPSGNAGNVEKA